MTTFVNKGDQVLVVAGNDVSVDDVADFVAVIEQHIDHVKLQTTNLSDLKKGKFAFFIDKYFYFIINNSVYYLQILYDNLIRNKYMLFHIHIYIFFRESQCIYL